MCGRFSFHTLDRLKKIMKLLGEEEPINLSGNITPFAEICAVYNNEENISAYRNMYWQLIPDFCEEFKSKYTMFNTRSEDLFDKDFKRELAFHKRCLIPAHHYYEWKKEGKDRALYNFSVESKDIILFAGIYSIWRDPMGLTERYSCSILTTKAAPEIEFIHDRMPVIFTSDKFLPWLDRNITDEFRIKELLEPSDRINILYKRLEKHFG